MIQGELAKAGTSRTAWWDIPGGPVAKTLHSNAGDLGLIPGQETRSHLMQLSVPLPQLKIPHATSKTRCNPVNLKKKKKEHYGELMEEVKTRDGWGQLTTQRWRDLCKRSRRKEKSRQVQDVDKYSYQQRASSQVRH